MHLRLIKVLLTILINFTIWYKYLLTENYAQEKKIFVIEKILNLGKGDETSIKTDYEYFGGINNISIDLSGNLILADYIMKNVRKFNKDGKFVWEISQLGKGPGELLRPWLTYYRNNLLYIYDISKRKIIIYNDKIEFQREFTMPYYLYSFFVSDNGYIYASGVTANLLDLSNNKSIHIFDNSGIKKKSFGKEIRFKPIEIDDQSTKMIIYHQYAGNIALTPLNNKLLASPEFDSRTFVYTLEGKLLYYFKNSNFNYKLLNYEIKKRGRIIFSIWETKSGPAFGFGKEYIIKSYQVSKKKGHVDYFMDIFDKNGSLIENQIPINGIVMNVSEEGLLYASSFHPFTQIWIYQLKIK